ncbi:MAG TPA: type II CAAX endopeptidase family protein [Acidobacteriaceae bacterium]|nr:type II CAAX endopeptidase family protein [Acidobacteriaceae bacterium]
MRDGRSGEVTPASDSDAPVRDRPAVPGHKLFFGPQGLRAGWAILVYATICAILIVVCGLSLSLFVHLHAGVPISPSIGLLIEMTQFLPVVGATVLMARLEHRPLLSYGFQGRARGIRLVSGFVFGFVAISAVVVVLRQLGALSFDGRTMGGIAALRYAVMWAAMFLCVGFCEEAMFRGYAQFTITRGMGFWWGALFFSVPFGLLHAPNPGESLVGLVGAGAASLIFCLSLWYTGSLWWAVGFHASWDWGQSYFYGTADSGLVAQGHFLASHPVGQALWSGGTTGPEGSVIVIPILLVVALLMAAWWERRGEKPFRGMAWRPGRLQ